MPDCEAAIGPNLAQALHAALREVDGTDGCEFTDLRTEKHSGVVTFEKDGQALDVVTVGPSHCLESANVSGKQLDAKIPESLAAACPKTEQALRNLIREQTFGTLIPPGQVEPEQVDEPSAPLPVFHALAIAASILLGLMLVRALKGRAWRGAGAWLGLAAGAFAVAAFVRLVLVEPAPANWYSEVVAPGRTVVGRFGSGGIALQRLVVSFLPWTDDTLFTVNALVGASSVALLVALCRNRRVPWFAAAMAAGCLALAPMHVRASASLSHHVLSSTLTMAALASWTFGVRKRAPLAMALGLLCVAMSSLTRADAWTQQLVVLIFGVFLDREEAPARVRPWAQAVIFGVWWSIVGLYVWLVIANPSHHPFPNFESIQQTARQLPDQFFASAFKEPHWTSPVTVLLASLGALVLLFKRSFLLTSALLGLFALHVPLGRMIVRDQLLVGRYFLVSFALLALLAGFGADALRRGAARLARRSSFRLAKSKWWPAVAVATPTLALVWLGAQPAYGWRYTFQDEYSLLKHELAKLDDGCTVYQIPMRTPARERDLDCCLWLRDSPLPLLYPKLTFRDLPMHFDGTLREFTPPNCAYYFESAACSIRVSPEDRPQALPTTELLCEQALKQHHGKPVLQAEVSGHDINGFFGQAPVPVRLLRLED